MPDDTSVTTDAIAAYAAGRPELEAATERFVELVRELLDDAGINYLSVTGRTKSVESFAAKAERRHEGALLHPDPLVDITDQMGVRVITFVPDDVTAVAKLLAEELAVIDDRDMGQETARAGRFGYASRHLLVSVDASRTIPAAYSSLRRRSASVQIRTVLQHAWAEFEHDIRYKGTVPEEHAHDLDRRFTLAAGPARARRPGVLGHPGAAPAGPAREARRPRRAGRPPPRSRCPGPREVPRGQVHRRRLVAR